MNIGSNLQYLRMLHQNMTQEELANRLGVSRQTVSKWELSQGNPELGKLQEICTVFNCSADDVLFGNMRLVSEAYSAIAIEKLKAFTYLKHTVISTTPEEDAIQKIRQMAKALQIDPPDIIGWDFPHVSHEQVNVHHMHGYTAALVLPEGELPKGMLPEGVDHTDSSHPAENRKAQRYVTMTIRNPMENPFQLISNAYKSLFQYIRVNRYTYDHFAFERSFHISDTEYMKVFVAIQSRA